MWVNLLIATTIYLKYASGASGNVNGAEFNVLCEIVNMLKEEKIGEPKADTLYSLTETSRQEINRIFIMTSNDTYFQAGPVPISRKDPETPADKQQRINEWKAKRQSWEGELSAGPGSLPKYRRKPKNEIHEATAHKRERIYKLASEADAAIASANTQLTTSVEEIKKETREALLGGTRSGKGPFPPADDKIFKADYTTQCTGTAGPSTSLAGDLVCLCGVAQSSGPGTLKMCTTATVTSYTDNHDGGTNALKIYTNLASICAKHYSAAELSEATITAAITGFKTLLGRHSLAGANHNGAYTYGKGDTSGNACLGTSVDSKSCVNDAAAIADGGGKKLAQAIAWLGHLEAARNKLQTRTNLVQTKTAQQKRLTALSDMMQELYAEALHTEKPNQVVRTVPPPTEKSGIQCLKKIK
uniref:Variant surface glycoprotein 1125.4982 n=1 Tax=Trypanosoma brucei TaxID=5691 RepID=A0A1J0RB59_9TRYP|nr:variant surface glycoprotein 1125.4982 [Trypanosoma brucei]